MTEKTLRALESAIRLSKLRFDPAGLTPTQVIACDGLVDEWAPGKYAANDVRTFGGQTWRCAQAHDSTENPAWTPEAERALWVPYHTKDPARARAYLPPTMAEDAYYTDECILWPEDGLVYRCQRDGTTNGPDIRPEDWEVVSDPAEEG